jgi:hypothetical protein
LESLCYLLADDGFLPALFASFDCDPTRSDLVQPMIQYLSQCARFYLFYVALIPSFLDLRMIKFP